MTKVIRWTKENAEKISVSAKMEIEEVLSIGEVSCFLNVPIYHVHNYIYPMLSDRNATAVYYVNARFIEEHFDFDIEAAKTELVNATLKPL